MENEMIINNYEILKEYLGKKREGTLSNDEVCMLTALIWSSKSKDPSTQVGACIVGEDGRVLSIGYNGTPNTWNNDEFPWGNNVDEIGEENTKYPYVIHAEMNAIMNYKGTLKDLKNSTIYVTLFPCSNCAKLIAQSGIKKVVYLVDNRKNTIDNKCAKILLKSCNVELKSYDELNTKTISEINLSVEDENNIKVKKYKNE